MHRNTSNYQIENVEVFKRRMLNWADRFNIFCLLDNCGYDKNLPAFDFLLAVGSRREYKVEKGLGGLDTFLQEQNDWVFAHMNYEMLASTPVENSIGFCKGYFFSPITLLRIKAKILQIETHEESVEDIYQSILNTDLSTKEKFQFTYQSKSAPAKEDYLKKIIAVKEHIQKGDCYELNYCNHYFFHNAALNPVKCYERLVKISPSPFSSLYKNEGSYCICSSPERYIKKTESQIISQPIKGTSKRNLQDSVADEATKAYLLQSEKERSENVMVVDLVRNDLSRICKPGSVQVAELFGIYSFPTVHQMISTVEGKLKADSSFSQILSATFPMGSMTGAPKKRVMELIEKYEEEPRGLFSGSIGYIDPGGDFDFNVVIRSIFYNETKQIVSYAAGGGITINSDPEKEWEESLLKMKAVEEVLGIEQNIK